jgi:hypothetical protein
MAMDEADKDDAFLPSVPHGRQSDYKIPGGDPIDRSKGVMQCARFFSARRRCNATGCTSTQEIKTWDRVD